MAKYRGAVARMKLLEHIETYTGENGWAPSYRELEEFLACDPETVSIHLAALAQEGLIRYIKGSSRAIALTS